MKVLIVGKTRMNNGVCVGGLNLETNTNVRLLNTGGINQPRNTDFMLGQVWEMDYHNRHDIVSPHVEDVIIDRKELTENEIDTRQYLIENNLVNYRGNINNIFDGNMHWTESGSGYVLPDGPMQNKSVIFWESDRDLLRHDFNEKIRYRYSNPLFEDPKYISFVGFQDAIDPIPTGSIIRFSLSRPFPPEGSPIRIPRGCYLQLSGWY